MNTLQKLQLPDPVSNDSQLFQLVGDWERAKYSVIITVASNRTNVTPLIWSR